MMKSDALRSRSPVSWLTVTAVFMAMNIALSSFGMPVPGGHLYLNDIVICTAAILLDVGGLWRWEGSGRFLGDFFRSTTRPMFVSLVTHGLSGRSHLPSGAQRFPATTVCRGRSRRDAGSGYSW